MIDIEIKKKLGSFLLNISFRSDKNRIGILGASGSGKSMTLKCIAGIETPDSGHIIINGRTYFDSEKRIKLSPQKRMAGYLFQNYALFPASTAEGNIMLAARGTRAKRRKTAETLITQFGIESCKNLRPSQLSGGQQQRTALARLIASEPELILLDEPFSALDGFLREKLSLETSAALERLSVPFITVSHDRDEIYRLSDDIVIMDSGAVCAFGDTKSIFKTPPDLASAQLTGCKSISPIIKTGSHEIYAKEWDITLKTEAAVADSIKYVGIHAHDIRFCAAPCVNSLKITSVEAVALPSETTYIINGSLWLKTPRPVIERSYICLPPEKLLFLR